MANPPRTVKIDQDERVGWSSDRPRSGPARPVDISVRCRTLKPGDRLRYTPGSLVVLVSGSQKAREKFAERVFEEQGAVMSLAKVRALLAGRVGEDELDERAAQLLDAAVRKRLDGGQAVVLVADDPSPETREPLLRAAAALRRPRHMIFIEAPRDQVAEEDVAVLNELRRTIDAGELGSEGFHTAMRLGGDGIQELKRIVFRPPPVED